MKDLIKNRQKNWKVSVTICQNGFRASMRLKYKDGTKERLQKFSSESPEKAIEKLYKLANEKYYSNLYKSDDKVVFSPTTNNELAEIEKDMPNEVIAETKNCLQFKNVAKEWLDSVLEKTNKEEYNRTINNNTFEYYRTMTYNYLVKNFEKYKITELTTEIIQKVFDSRASLGFKTLKGLKSILSQICRYAMKKGYILKNPALDIELPDHVKPQIDFYNEKQLKNFKDACENDGRTIAMLYRTIASLGLRPEERMWTKMGQDNFFRESR